MNLHYNYCGNCNDYTPHYYEKSGGIKWELCTNDHYALEYNLSKLSAIIESKNNERVMPLS